MGWVVNATPWSLYPLERHPVPIVQEAGWASGQVLKDAENLAPTGSRSPDRPALSESPYRLRYPGPHQNPVYIFLSMHATCFTHTTFVDFITLIMSAEECKFRRLTLCNFLNPPVPHSVLDPKILLRTLF